MPVFLHQYDTILQYNMTLMEQSKRYSKKFWRFAPQNPKHCIPKPIQSTESMLTADDSFASLLCNACQKPCLFAWCSGTVYLQNSGIMWSLSCSFEILYKIQAYLIYYDYIWRQWVTSWEGYRIPDTSDGGVQNSRHFSREGYRIPAAPDGRGSEFLTTRLENSIPPGSPK